MENIIALVGYVSGHWLEIIGAVTLFLNALIAIFVLVPGSEPEATLQKIVNFIAKFSAK